ncbi:hypothetical protein EGW08_007409, partial [Elysia chlorotica]
EQRGVYDCTVRFNFAGQCWQKELRHRLGFFDNNPFAPIWVSTLLLEAELYGGGIEPSDQQLYRSLDYLKTTIDKTRDYENSLIGFYPYQFDEGQDRFVMRRVFVEEIVHMFQDLPPPMLDGFEYIIRQEIASSGFMVMQNHTVSPVFPADSDDTFSWLGLGAALSLTAGQLGTHAGPLQAWLDLNPNITSAFDAVKRYAYRPFSRDPDSSTIDARTYLALRHFLDGARQAGHDVTLVTTWFQSVGDGLKGRRGDMTMPTLVNDVCLAVGANVLYGMTALTLARLVPADTLDDPDVTSLLTNTSALIAHMLRHDFHARHDLSLFYYPPKNQFFFFLSRSLFLMEMYKNDPIMRKPVLQTVHTTIKQTLEENVTNYLINNRQHTDENFDAIFFDDFLGDGDFTEGGDPIRRGEDRIFSTSMAANALMYTWTSFDRRSNTLSWKPGVPSAVTATVRGCVRWLALHAVDSEFKPWNAFFSSGRKGLHNLPFWYPANRFQFLNGTHLRFPERQNQLPVDMFFAGMQGYVPRDQYEAMLSQPHFGRDTPTNFPGYNAPGWNSFAIWSSEAYSYAAALLAVSLFDSLA